MKLDRDAELAMLELEVKPKIQKARECLREGKTEEMGKIIARDMVGLFQTYKKSETEKYDNAPDNLKGSPNSERMLKNARLYQEAINLLWDEETDILRPVDENTLDAVDNIVNDIMNS